jgi:hypothetical protein
MFLEFGECLPDLPSLNNPGATVVNNVQPYAESYGPFPDMVVYSNALDARCQGMFASKDSSGTTYNFAGDASKLYLQAQAVYSDVSVAGGYSTATDDRWYFTKYGERIIATNFSDPMQSYVLGSSSAFANLSVAAPRARYITTINDFVMVANTFDGIDGNVPHRVRWSGIGDPTDWTVSASTQSDFQDLDSTAGWCQQIVGGDYGVVFQERAISRIDYAGSPTIWTFREVERGRGTPAPGSVVKVGNFIFYLDNDGFRVFDGNQSIPIGANKIDRTFFNELDNSYMARICAMVNFNKQIIYWGYPASGNVGGRCNRILCYNYSPNARKRFTFIDNFDFEILGNMFAEGYTLDTLDMLSGSLDNLPFSLDSRAYTGNSLVMSAFDANHKQNNFTGSDIDATIETQEGQLFPDNRALVSLVRPVVDGTGTVTVQMGTRNTLAESVSYANAVSTNSTGDCPVRSNARFHRARVNISGGFNHAQGINVVKATKAGMR